MTDTIPRPWCSDPKPMTRERILELTKSKGRFTVHRYLYRAESLRKALRKMAKAGLLKFAGCDGDFVVYILPPPPPQEKPNVPPSA